jgi:hypothetical protein
MSDEDEEPRLVRCDTCRAFGPDVREVGESAYGVPVRLCRPCRERQGFEEPRNRLPRPSVIKGQHPGEIKLGGG